MAAYHQKWNSLLTDALFSNARLDSRGAGTKAEARAQARRMLAADALLEACKKVVGYLADNRGRGQMEVAIALAESPQKSTQGGR